jgi:branched-chain amino acid transport system ATP-binding protein
VSNTTTARTAVPEYLLEATGLTREFSGFVALDNVSFNVSEGAVCGLIGPNGAGKTTCFNLLTKFLKPSRGTIRFKGRDITHLQPAEVAQLGIGRSFQISAVFPRLTALENVRAALQRRRGESFDFWNSDRRLKQYDERAQILLTEVGLRGWDDAPAALLPYGRKRALELATTLALDPDLLLLDEPTAGMAHEDVDRIVALIKKLKAGRTVFMVEHNLSVVQGLCDHVIVLTRGSVLAEGDYDSVATNPAVIEAYIGADDA